jgi:hypothetical protein
MSKNKLSQKERFIDLVILILFFPLVFGFLIYTIFKIGKK